MSTASLSRKWPYDLVEILWLDASGDTGWKFAKKLEEEATEITTICFLIRRTRTHYLTAGSISYDTMEEDHSLGDRNHIPKGMVKKMTVLVPKNTEPKVEAAEQLHGSA